MLLGGGELGGLPTLSSSSFSFLKENSVSTHLHTYVYALGTYLSFLTTLKLFCQRPLIFIVDKSIPSPFAIPL